MHMYIEKNVKITKTFPVQGYLHVVLVQKVVVACYQKSYLILRLHF